VTASQICQEAAGHSLGRIEIRTSTGYSEHSEHSEHSEQERGRVGRIGRTEEKPWNHMKSNQIGLTISN